MKKKWIMLGVIFTLIMGNCSMIAQADVGGSSSGGRGGGGSSSSSSSRPSGGGSTGHHGRGSRNSPLPLVAVGVGSGYCMLLGFKQRKQKKIEIKTALSKMREADPAFKEDVFYDHIQEIFLSVQEAWSLRDMTPVKDLETPALFRQHQSQLEMYHEKNWTPHVKTKRITCVQLVSFSETSHEISVIVFLSARVRDYTLNQEGLVVEGLKRNIYHRDYRLRFTRLKGKNQYWRLEDYRQWVDNEFFRCQ